MWFLLVMIWGCGTTEDTGELISDELSLFCESIDEAGNFEFREDAASFDGANGSLYARIITGASEDPHNPNFVGDVSYVIDNIDIGGAPIYGASNMDGEVLATLGHGNWRVQVSNNRVAGYTCYSEIIFEVQPGLTTYLCLDINCK